MIEKILNAKSFRDVCGSHAEYKKLALELHPDKCKDARACSAFAHLTELKQIDEKGIKFSDECGDYVSNGYWTQYQKTAAAELSMSNYAKLKNLAHRAFNGDKRYLSFLRYLPEKFEDYCASTTERALPLSYFLRHLKGTENEWKHYNWIYSRLIEFCANLQLIGVTHCGINPDSVFVSPKLHGIYVNSFYHTSFDNKVKTICGTYQSFYPHAVFATKESGSYIDIALAKKTILLAMGDPSGAGVLLRLNKNINKNLLDYLMTPEFDAVESFKTWREILNKNYKSEFIELTL
jgi:hypothetical protein